MLYTRDRWIEQGDRVDTVGASYDWGWVDLTRFDDKEGQVMADTPLLVNIKGCGYAPDINCGSFANKYQAGFLHCVFRWNDGFVLTCRATMTAERPSPVTTAS